jgi:hypothetical protein
MTSILERNNGRARNYQVARGSEVTPVDGTADEAAEREDSPTPRVARADSGGGGGSYHNAVGKEVRRSGKLHKTRGLGSGANPTQRLGGGNQPSQLSDLDDLMPPGSRAAGGGSLEQFIEEETSQSRASPARGASRRENSQIVPTGKSRRGLRTEVGPGRGGRDFRGKPIRENAPPGVPGGLPSVRNGVDSVTEGIEQQREKHAEETALAQELLRRQAEFEKNATDKMDGFVDRHGFSWYHVLMVLIINNIIVVLLGATVSSSIMSAGFSPLGVVQSDSLHAVQSGDQNVMIESIHGPSAVTVRPPRPPSCFGCARAPVMIPQAHSITRPPARRSRLTPSMRACVRACVQVRSGEGRVSRMVLEEGPDGVDGFVVSSAGYLQSGVNRPLRLVPAPAQNLLLEPSAGGSVDCAADLDVSGALAVTGDFVAGAALRVENATSTVRVGWFGGSGGSGGAPANLAVSGAVTATRLSLPDPSGGLTVAGSAQLQGGATVSGNLVVTGRMSVFRPDAAGGRRRRLGSNFGASDELMRIESDGSIYTEANLTVGSYAVLQDTEVSGRALFQGDIIFGDSPSDTIHAYGTTNFHHTVSIGDDATDDLTVAGATTFSGSLRTDGQVVLNGDVSFPLAAASLDIASTVIIRGEAQLTGGVTIGGGPLTTTAFVSNVLVGPTANDMKLQIFSATGNLVTVGGMDITGPTSLQKMEVHQQADFRAPVGLHAAVTASQGLIVSGLTKLNNDLRVSGSAHMRGSLVVLGTGTALNAHHDVVLGTNRFDTLIVKGVTQFMEAVNIENDFTVGKIDNDLDFRIRSNVVVEGPTQNTVTIMANSGDIHTVGDVTVGGVTTVQDLAVNGAATLGTNTIVGQSALNTMRVLATSTFSAPVTLGEAASHTIRVWGRAEFEEALTAERTFFAKGDTVLGDTGTDTLTVNAAATFNTQLTATGHVMLGDDIRDAIVVKGLLAVQDASGFNRLTIEPNTGKLATQGQLTVAGNAHLDAAVTLGSGPQNTISVLGATTFSSTVTIGDDSVDFINVMGSATFSSAVNLQKSAPLTVEGDVTLGASDGSSSLTIQAPLSIARTLDVSGEMKVQGTMSVYSTLSVKNALHAPVLTLATSGDLTATGGITASTASFQALTVAGSTALRGGLKVGDPSAASPDLTHGLNVFGHTTMRGNLFVGRNFEVTGSAALNGNVVVQAGKSFTAAGQATLGTVTVSGLATFSDDATFAQDVVLGNSIDNDLVAVNGRLEVQHNGAKMLSVYPVDIPNFPTPGSSISAGVRVHGALTVLQATSMQAITVAGDATFHDDVTLGAAGKSVTVNSAMALNSNAILGSPSPSAAATTLDVHSNTVFYRNVDLRDNLILGPFVPASPTDKYQLTVNSVSSFKDSVDIEGNVGITGTTTVYGSVDMYTASNGGDLTIRMRSADGYLFGKGDLTVGGSATIGDDASDSLVMTGRLQVGSGVPGAALTFNANPETGFVDVNADHLRIQAETTVRHNFFVKDTTGSTMFRVQASTGSVWVEGDLHVTGELKTADKPLTVGTLYADTILGTDSQSGVTIEGVQFRAGGFRIAKTDQISELTNGAGTSVEGVLFKNGAIVLGEQTLRNTGDPHFPQMGTANYPKGEHQLATIINSAHGHDMDGTITSVVFKQYYEHSNGDCPPGTSANCGHFAANAGKIKFGTESDWSEVHSTHDAYIAVETVYQGNLLERMRIFANGDIAFTQSRFFFQAATGNTDISGDVTIGAVAGKRKMIVTSTDDDSSLQISSAANAGKSARLLIDGDYTEARLVAKESKDARLALMDAGEDGYAWSRTGTTNVLALDRIERGPGSTITVAANSPTVVANAAGGDFSAIKPGDHILVNIGCEDAAAEFKTCMFGEVVSRLVTAVNTGATPDSLTVASPFSATVILTNYPYYVARRISTVTDANTMTFGGTTGSKSFSVQSTDKSSALQVEASLVGNKASLTVTGNDDAETMVLAGQNQDARLELEESGACTTDAVTQVVTCTGGRGYTLWRGAGTSNKMYMFRTYVSAFTVAVVASNAPTATSLTLNNGASVSAAGVNNVAVGDYIIITIDGVEEVQKVTAIDTASGPEKIVVALPFTTSVDIPTKQFKVARPILTVNDDNNVVFGDTSGAKEMKLVSLDDSVEQIVQANGVLNEAKVTITSDSNTALELHSGQNDDARIKMRDSHNGIGYTIARKYSQQVVGGVPVTNNNILVFDSTSPGPGGTVSCLRGTTTITSSALLFGALKPRDHFIVVRDGVEFTRMVVGPLNAQGVFTGPATVGQQHTLEIDRAFSNTWDVTNLAYTIGQRVLEFTSKDDVVIGGNTGAKTLSYSSTDDEVTMSIDAKGAGNVGALRMRGDDAVELSMEAGAAKDVRVELQDATSAGYRFTRTSANNDLFLHRTSPGPSTGITVVAGATTVTAANPGEFTATPGAVRKGDLVVVTVPCAGGTDCGSQQAREVTGIAANGATLTVASAFSTDSVITNQKFEVARKILSVDKLDTLSFGASGGEKKLVVESKDQNAFLELKSHVANSLAKVDVSGDVALVDINSGKGQNTKIKLRDHDTGAGYVFARDSRPKSCDLSTDPCAGVITPGNGNPTNAATCYTAGGRVVGAGTQGIIDPGVCIYSPPTSAAGESCLNSCNSFSLRRTLEGANTVTCAGGSTSVAAVADGQFASIRVGDKLTVLVNGVETTRLVTAVTTGGGTPDSLSIDAQFSATVNLQAVTYVVERPVLTVPNENKVVVGGSSGSKQMTLASTDSAADMLVLAKGASAEAHVQVQSDARASLVTQAGQDKDAVLQLVSTTPRAHGFTFTRGGGSANTLFLDRTEEGPMGTITVNANSATVQAKDDGAFDTIRVGDRLVVNIDGVEYSQLVTAVCLTGVGVYSATCEPDELTLAAVLHPTKQLTAWPYMVYKTVLTVNNDDSVTFFGNRGCGAKDGVACATKSVTVQSTDSAAKMTLQSAGAQHPAELTLKAGADYANLRVQSSNDKDSRLYLTDDSDTGFMFRKAKGGTNALSGSAYAASANALVLERTVSLARPAARLTSSGGTKKCEANLASDFANIRNGDFITIIWNGVEIQRMVTQLTLQIGVVDVDAPFSATLGVDVTLVEYFVTRPLVAFDDYHKMLVGGTMSAAIVDIVSTHNSATLKVEASDSPVGQADSTGAKGHAEIKAVSESVSSLGAYVGANQDARLKLHDMGNDKGFMMVRMDTNTESNKLVNFRVEVGPGGSMNCQAGSTTVQGTGSVVNHLSGGPNCPTPSAATCLTFVNIGDYIMTVIDGIDVIRRVTALSLASSQDTMTIDQPFSATTPVNTQPWYLLRPVVTLKDDNSYLFGGTAGMKDFKIESTNDGASLALIAKGAGNRADFRVQGEGVIDADFQAGTNEEIRLKLRDSAKGFVMTRDGVNNALHTDSWVSGPSNGMQVNQAGGSDIFASGVGANTFASIKVGDRIVFTVNGAELTRKVTGKSTIGTDILAVDLPIPSSVSAGTPFYVSRRASSLDDASFTLFGTDGPKEFHMDSLDNRIDVTFKSGSPANPATKVPAVMTLESQQMATLVVHAGNNDHARLKLEDHVNRRGFVFERGDGANNKLGLNRFAPGGGTITCLQSSLTCSSSATTFFPQFKVGDLISIAVNHGTAQKPAYVDTVRTIMTIAGSGATLTVNSMFSGQVSVIAQAYQIGRRVMTVESDDVVVFGGCRGCQNAGDKVVELSSTDAAAELVVEGLGYRALLTMRGGEDAVLDVGCGNNDEATVLLRDRQTMRGFSWTRLTGSGGAAETNMLQLHRTTNGPGATVTVAAGSSAVAAAGGVYVHASADGVFGGINVGDEIVITVGDREEARTVSQISDPGNAASFLGANPDYVKVSLAFSASAVLSNVPFHVRRKVLNFKDDNEVQFGASVGDKVLGISSLQGSAGLSVGAVGAARDATLSLSSAAADTAVTLAAAQNQNARIELKDGALGAGKGFSLERRTVSGDNELSLFWTGPGPGSTLTATGGATLVTLTGPLSAQIMVGEYVAVTHGGQRLLRKVTGKPATNTLTIEAAFTASGTDLSGVAYEHGKRVMSVESTGNQLRVGGAFGPTGGPVAEDTVDLSVSGDLTLAGMWTMRTQTVPASVGSIVVESSHLQITSISFAASGVVHANRLTVANPAALSAGTVLFVENLDDNDSQSPLVGGVRLFAQACEGQSRCMFVYDGTQFQRFSDFAMF